MTEDKWEKCIIMGLPMEICFDEPDGATIRGYFSYIYFYAFLPIESLMVESFRVMTYEGSYWSALGKWMFGDNQ